MAGHGKRAAHCATGAASRRAVGAGAGADKCGQLHATHHRDHTTSSDQPLQLQSGKEELESGTELTMKTAALNTCVGRNLKWPAPT
eukprot:355126-Chlamydomonas_euryale.AAC.5